MQPEPIIALTGVVMIGAAGVLFRLTPLPFFAGIIGLFMLLGVLVARDARCLGQNGLAWGFATLFFGPFVVVLYVWFRSGLQAAAAKVGTDHVHKPARIPRARTTWSKGTRHACFTYS